MIFPVKVTEHVFIALVPCSKHDNLHCILAQFVHNIGDQVKSLLVSQTGNDADKHCFRIFVKPEISLKLEFIFYLFLAESLGIICLGDVLVCLLIEYVVVNSVDDSSQAVGTCLKKTFQTFAVERGFDFLRICFAHCSHSVCKDDSSFQEVGVFVCFQFIRSKIVVGKSRNSLYCLHIPYALEFQVVDRHNCFYIPEKLILLESIVKIYRYKSCLPVMAVDNVRTESDHRKHRKHSFGEESKFLQIPGRAVIRLRTAEIVFIVDKVELDSVIFHLHDPDITVLISQIHIEMSDVLHLVFPFLFHAGVFRKNDANIKITLVKAFRQRPRYVCQPSGFNKRYCL